MDDRLDPVQLLRTHVAKVGVDLWNRRDGRRTPKVQPRYRSNQPYDFVSGGLKDRDDDRPDIPERPVINTRIR